MEMAEGGADGTEAGTNADGSEMPAAEEETTNARTTFLSYLTSPIVNLSIGSPDTPPTLQFGVSHLKRPASSKIHGVNSTARGEIACIRYMHAYTSKDDTKVRALIDSFWATRSHTLRSEVEDEFKQLCLEYPQFGYDALSKYLPGRLSGWDVLTL